MHLDDKGVLVEGLILHGQTVRGKASVGAKSWSPIIGLRAAASGKTIRFIALQIDGVMGATDGLVEIGWQSHHRGQALGQTFRSTTMNSGLKVISGSPMSGGDVRGFDRDNIPANTPFSIQADIPLYRYGPILFRAFYGAEIPYHGYSATGFAADESSSADGNAIPNFAVYASQAVEVAWVATLLEGNP